MPDVAVLHVGQHHQGEPFSRQHDAQQRQDVRVVEALHDQALSEKLVHLLQICDPWKVKKIQQAKKNVSFKLLFCRF